MSVIAPFLVMGGLWLALTHGPAAIVAMLRKLNARTGAAYAAQITGVVIMVAAGAATPVRAAVATLVCALVGKLLWKQNAAALLGALLGYAGASASSFTGLGCILIGGAVLAAGVLAVPRKRLARPVRVAVKHVQACRDALRGVKPSMSNVVKVHASRALTPSPVRATRLVERVEVAEVDEVAPVTEAIAIVEEDEEADVEELETIPAEAETLEAETLEGVVTPAPKRRRAGGTKRAPSEADEAVLARVRARRSGTAGSEAVEPVIVPGTTDAHTKDRGAEAGVEDTREKAEIDRAFDALKEMFDRS